MKIGKNSTSIPAFILIGILMTCFGKSEAFGKTVPGSKKDIGIKTENNEKRKPLILEIKNLTPNKGVIKVGFYGVNNKFLDDNDQLKRFNFFPESENDKSENN